MMGDAALPGGWKWRSLAETTEVILGQSPPGSTYNADGRGLPFFQGKAEFGSLYPRILKWCTAPSKIAEAEDVLVSVRAPVGPTNLCPQRSAIGRGLAALRPRDGMPSRYLLYAMRATERSLLGKATGSTFDAVSGTVLRSHLIPVAPPEQWDSIVEAIEQQLTRLDSAIDLLTKARRDLKTFEASAVAAAARARQRAQGERTGSPPDHWELRPLPEVAVNLDARRVPVNARERAKRQGSTPYYGATGQVGWIDGFLFDEELVLLGEDGAPFLDPLAPKAYIVRGKSWVNNHAHVLRPIQSLITAEFLKIALNAANYHGLVNGTTRLKLTQAAMNRILIAVPPLDEQLVISRALERTQSVVAALARGVTRGIGHATALRRSVLQAAFIGQLAGVEAQ